MTGEGKHMPQGSEPAQDTPSLPSDNCSSELNTAAAHARLSSEEFDEIERLCEAAIPGPLVFDDSAVDDGALVATLPDGRNIVSLSDSLGYVPSSEAIEATGQLICRARTLLLRLVHDARCGHRERDRLLARIAELESLPAPQPQKPSPPPESATPNRPR